MANPYAGGRAKRDNPYKAPPASTEGRGPLGFVGNLFGDVKDTVVGLPMGAVETVRNPIKSVKAMGGAAWQTWSPLFQGDFAKFGKQVYDHPLAPLLDVATVFTLGTSGAARGASALSKSGVQSAKVEKVAGLARPKRVELNDPDPSRGLPVQARHLSDRPGRRVMQELGQLGPSWYVGKRNAMRFENLTRKADAGMSRALHEAQAAAIMKAGEALSDPDSAPIARAEINAHNYLNILRNGGLKGPVTNEEAMRLKATGKFGITKSARRLDRQSTLMLRRADKEFQTWNTQREQNAEMANALPKIEKELAEANRELARMYRDGYRAVMPAKGRRKEPSANQRMEQEAAPILDVERRVKDLEKRLDSAHKAKAAHNKAVSEIERITDWRTQLEDRNFKEFFRQGTGSQEDFIEFNRTLGSRIAARGLQDAARPKVVVDGKWVDDPNRVYVHRVRDVELLGKEAANSASFVGKLYREGTSVWKTIQLGYTPRTVTNNGVGNWLIDAARSNPLDTAIGMSNAIRLTKGSEEAMDAAMGITGGTRRSTGFRRNNWVFRNFGDVVGNTFKQTFADETGKMPSRLRQGLYPLVAKLSDEPVRVSALVTYMRNSPEVKALRKTKDSTGRRPSLDQAVTRALKADPGLRERAVNYVDTVAGDYTTMRPWERTVRDIVPFYLWDRHILKTTANIALDTPGRVAIAQRVSNLGIETTEDILGELPEFLRGAIPLGKKGDRADILLTSSLNPFATISDLAKTAEALTTGGGVGGGSPVFSQLNPFITGPIQAATGRSLLTGGPAPSYGGVIPSVAVNTLMGFPQARLGKALITPDTAQTDAGNERLFAADDRSPLTSFLGVPLRNVSLEQAAVIAEREKPKRKKRRKKNPYKS